MASSTLHSTSKPSSTRPIDRVLLDTDECAAAAVGLAWGDGQCTSAVAAELNRSIVAD